MKDFKVIIPAAGKATRMRPLSSALSKAMIPVNGKPIISYIIDQLFVIGNPTEIVIVHNEFNDIQTFVKNTYPHLYENEIIKFKQQMQPLGPLHAVREGANVLDETSEEPIMVWLGDTICLESNKFNLSKSFLVTSTVEDYSRWCMVDDQCSFYDKPAIPPRTDQALIGIYHFTDNTAFYRALSKGMHMPLVSNEHQISSLLMAYIEDNRFFDLVSTSKWYDCGDLNTFYESKARLLNRSARAFNNITVDTFIGTVTKTANTEEGKNKIEREKQWFNTLDQTTSLFMPRVLDTPYGVLTMSLEPGTALNEMWLYDNLRHDVWVTILDKILNVHNNVFLKTELHYKITPADVMAAMKEMYITKNLKRLEGMRGMFPGYEIVLDFVREVGNDLLENGHSWWSGVFHGDSHLGNILFEPLHGSMKFVDPRGSFGGLEGTQGDMRYDMAKISQDIYLNYSDILAGNYRWNENRDGIILHRDKSELVYIVQHLKAKLTEYGYDWKQIFKLSIVLMITCIPFHADDEDRQRAFWFNAIEHIKAIS